VSFSLANTNRLTGFVPSSGRQALIDSPYATVICAPVYSSDAGLASRVSIGPAEGLKHPSAILCDGLVSLSKAVLTDYVGSPGVVKTEELDRALKVASGVEG
jgi:mRNA interferase MazF